MKGLNKNQFPTLTIIHRYGTVPTSAIWLTGPLLMHGRGGENGGIEDAGCSGI